MRSTKKKKVVLTYGTFDLFHIGHLNILKRLRELGDQLIVGVSTDDFNRTKGKNTFISFPERIEIVGSLRCVDDVFAERTWDQKAEDIRRNGVDILGMGGDWEGRFDHLRDLCEVVYLPRTDAVSSSQLRQAMKVLDKDHVAELKTALDIIASVVRQFE